MYFNRPFRADKEVEEKVAPEIQLAIWEEIIRLSRLDQKYERIDPVQEFVIRIMEHEIYRIERSQVTGDTYSQFKVLFVDKQDPRPAPYLLIVRDDGDFNTLSIGSWECDAS